MLMPRHGGFAAVPTFLESVVYRCVLFFALVFVEVEATASSVANPSFFCGSVN